MINIDYETICVNCKEKGYSFGYTLKTVEYLGNIVLDTPQRHLNGPSLAFDYLSVPILIRSLENSHSMGAAAKTPLFSMINAKPSLNSSISRFTYLYSPQHHPDVKKLDKFRGSVSPKIFEYVDMYQYPNSKDRPYILFFYTFRNSTQVPLENFRFYQFYDFDIYGQERYDTDLVKYNPSLGVIYQFDHAKQSEHEAGGNQQSIVVGIGSTLDNKPLHFEGNTPEHLIISPNRLNLRDTVPKIPGDLGVGLQWYKSEILPGHLEVFPVFMAFGNNEAEFLQNAEKAQIHIEKLISNIIKSVNFESRQLTDPKLEKMSFSIREWCQD
ncbi:MAG: hypothetical protein ACTSRK_18000 [Promethearchaeota archaeon]